MRSLVNSGSTAFASLGLALVLASGSAVAVHAAAPEVVLAGPLVQKLDWNTRSLQASDINADGLLDLVVASPGEYSWEGVRAELASLYRAAGMPSIATFVSSPTAGVN